MSQQLSLFDIEKENGLQISPEEKRQHKELYSQGYRFVTDNSELLKIRILSRFSPTPHRTCAFQRIRRSNLS